MAEQTPIDTEQARKDMLSEIRDMQSEIVSRFKQSLDINDMLNLTSAYQNLTYAALTASQQPATCDG